MADQATKTLEQLEEQLKTQQGELKDVDDALAEMEGDEELLALKADLVELISMTQVLIEKKKASQSAQHAKVDLDSLYLSPLATVGPSTTAAASASAAIASTGATSASEKSVQERAQAFGVYVGLKCEAVWSGDENWYTALVTEISPEGVTVRFTEYGDVETIAPEKVRLENGRGKKRKEPESATGALEIPKYMQILSTDSESVRKAKKKRIKAFKLQHRNEVREEETKQKKASWQEFAQQAGKKRKLGALTGSTLNL